jgi:hypothetical protein
MEWWQRQIENWQVMTNTLLKQSTSCFTEVPQKQSKTIERVSVLFRTSQDQVLHCVILSIKPTATYPITMIHRVKGETKNLVLEFSSLDLSDRKHQMGKLAFQFLQFQSAANETLSCDSKFMDQFCDSSYLQHLAEQAPKRSEMADLLLRLPQSHYVLGQLEITNQRHVFCLDELYWSLRQFVSNVDDDEVCEVRMVRLTKDFNPGIHIPAWIRVLNMIKKQMKNNTFVPKQKGWMTRWLIQPMDLHRLCDDVNLSMSAILDVDQPECQHVMTTMETVVKGFQEQVVPWLNNTWHSAVSLITESKDDEEDDRSASQQQLKDESIKKVPKVPKVPEQKLTKLSIVVEQAKEEKGKEEEEKQLSLRTTDRHYTWKTTEGYTYRLLITEWNAKGWIVTRLWNVWNLLKWDSQGVLNREETIALDRGHTNLTVLTKQFYDQIYSKVNTITELDVIHWETAVRQHFSKFDAGQQPQLYDRFRFIVSANCTWIFEEQRIGWHDVIFQSIWQVWSQEEEKGVRRFVVRSAPIPHNTLDAQNKSTELMCEALQQSKTLTLADVELLFGIEELQAKSSAVNIAAFATVQPNESVAILSEEIQHMPNSKKHEPQDMFESDEWDML